METINLLKKLISFTTTSNNKEAIYKALNWIIKEIKGLSIQYFIFKDKSNPFLLISTKKTKSFDMLLAGHIDVVSGSENLFSAKIVKNKLIGRGAYDMKFAIACYINLLKELKENLKNFNLGILITSDEEIGGFNGTKKFLDLGYKSKICFLPDGGENWNFELKAKGVWHLKIKSYGKSAHGSRPWEGKNSIENLLIFINKLKNIFPKEPCKDKNHWHNTLNIGKIVGGEATNQVANYTEVFIDIRYTELSQKNRILKHINNLLKKFKNIKIENLVEGYPYNIEKINPYLKLFSNIAKEKFNIKTGFTFSHGSSDARFFKEKNIPTILIRPKGGGQHSENEWIDINDLEKFYNVLKDFVIQSQHLN